MKVVFDGYWWVDGPISNQTVLIEIVSEWIKHFPEDEVEIVVAKSEGASPSYAGVKVRVFPRIYHPLFNLFFVSFVGWKNKAEIVVFQNFSGLAKDARVYIHDFIFFDHPEWFSRLERYYFALMKPMTQFFRPTVYTSSVTESLRISRFLKNRKVYVAPIGIRTQLALAVPAKPILLGSYEGPFIFAPGRNNPRKNIDSVISSYLELGAGNSVPKLVVLGLSSEEYFQTQVASYAHESILFIPYVSDAELAWLYKNCKIFIFLSFDEGFGMPVLEAKFFGAPSILSDIKIFREVNGTQGKFVKPNSIKDITNLMKECYESPISSVPSIHPALDIFGWDRAVVVLRKGGYLK